MDLGHPGAYGPLYAAGRPTDLTDPSGFAPYVDPWTQLQAEVLESLGGNGVTMAGDPRGVAIAVAVPASRPLLTRMGAAATALVADFLAAAPVTPTGVTTGTAVAGAMLAEPATSASQGDRTWGQEVAHDPDGHAWDHAQDGDFGDIADQDDLGDYLDGVIDNALDSKSLEGGRTAWLGEDGSVVIHNPDGPSTAFNPDSQGRSSQDYWEDL